MVSLDAVLGWVSILDIEHLMTPLQFLMRKIPVGHPLESATFVEIALQIIEEDPQAKSHLVLRRYGSLSASPRTQRGPNMVSMKNISRSMGTSRKRVVLPVDPSHVALPTAESPPPLQLLPLHKPLRSIFSNKERQWFLEGSARVLFTTEFVVLVEYFEVIVPFIYSKLIGCILKMQRSFV
ncbi:unnamed protein product [Phytophthora lilii]|uniref:Unnamed protein product n=1 Tax=Phytophthora lilii TaxID=2077276 RepID=A0A9W6X0Q5_9STRA|nr:unnamed protein product [Phytophthora lilii]